MDLKYIIDSTKLKEEIIVHKYSNIDRFIYNINYKGLILDKDEEGIIWGRDENTNEKLFYFQQPLVTLVIFGVAVAGFLKVYFTMNEKGDNKKWIITLNEVLYGKHRVC